MRLLCFYERVGRGFHAFFIVRWLIDGMRWGSIEDEVGVFK